MNQKLAARLFKWWGWSIEGEVPTYPKMVFCIAPHTSNWDLFVGELAYASLGMHASFLIKHEWTDRPIIGKWFVKLGGIGVHRDAKHSLTDQLAQKFREADHLHLAITPEGTRKSRPVWKRGFYHIAKKAQVPILLIGFDFSRKVIKIIGIFTPTEDEEADMRAIKRSFIGIQGKHPKNFSIGDAAE